MEKARELRFSHAAEVGAILRQNLATTNTEGIQIKVTFPPLKTVEKSRTPQHW